jgi:alginate O-acetyltransferase complex protein AlgI
MLFNSYIFIFVFLPIVLLGFHLIGKRGHHRIVISWLVGASLFFYGWWNPAYLGLILISIIFNYAVGVYLGGKPSKLILILGVVVNLSLIGYFKYANFFVDNFNVITDSNIVIKQIILPLAISFFTFQQITYLVDAYRGLTKEYNFLHYCLFVTFFPQLIAGPIVHHKEMLPQFKNDALYRIKASHLSVGLTIFALGLFKKVVFADNIAIHATPVFDAAENGVLLTFFEAWGGGLAYSFQLYFDFSGYSDMAVGIARMFGIVLPLNFFSPYKANSIIEFWHRWHITLSRFLRDYLYFPLGGNRKGRIRRYMNLMITMLLGGLWHGAGWTFIAWGGLHGLYLSINHGWRVLTKKILKQDFDKGFFYKIFGRSITFMSVVVAWVMFRAESLDGALNMYEAMFGFNGVSLPVWAEIKLGDFSESLKLIGINYNGMFYNDVFGNSKEGMLILFAMLLIVWFAPNTYELLKNEKPAMGVENYLSQKQSRIIAVWVPNIVYVLIISIVLVVAIMFIQQESEFLYFQF